MHSDLINCPDYKERLEGACWWEIKHFELAAAILCYLRLNVMSVMKNKKVSTSIYKFNNRTKAAIVKFAESLKESDEVAIIKSIESFSIDDADCFLDFKSNDVTPRIVGPLMSLLLHLEPDGTEWTLPLAKTSTTLCEMTPGGSIIAATSEDSKCYSLEDLYDYYKRTVK